MNKTIQVCNGCGGLNTAADTSWVRIFGAFAGSPSLFVVGEGSQIPKGASAPANAVKPLALDLCAACATTVKVSQLVELTTKAMAPAGTARPEVVALPVKAETAGATEALAAPQKVG